MKSHKPDASSKPKSRLPSDGPLRPPYHAPVPKPTDNLSARSASTFIKQRDPESSITTKSVKSLNSIGSHKDRKYDTIPFRLEFIKELLDGKELNPLIDFDNMETEDFVHPYGYKQGGGQGEGTDDSSTSSNTDESNKSKDTRYVIKKKIHDFYRVINEIGGKLQYIKSGTSGHTFKGVVAPFSDDPSTRINYAVKVVAYPKKLKYGDLNNIARPENAELMMIRLLSYFVIKKQTPHIVLPIGSFNTNIKPFVNLITDNIVDKDNKKYREFVEKYKNGEYFDHVSILISEWANRGDFLDFVRKNYKEFTLMHWKVFFFQIISVLAVIQSKFPSFRHNDLKANNILVHKVEQRKKLFAYTVNRSKYLVPSIGYQIKLWDFDFACIPGIVDNIKVDSKYFNKINIVPTQNKYYDLHYFFNTFIKNGFFPQFLEDSIVPVEAKEFVNRVVPEVFQKSEYVSDRGRILTTKEYTTPDKVLKNDPFFEEFRNNGVKRVHKKDRK